MLPIKHPVVGQCAPLVALQTSYSPRVNVLSRSVSQACKRSAQSGATASTSARVTMPSLSLSSDSYGGISFTSVTSSAAVALPPPGSWAGAQQQADGDCEDNRNVANTGHDRLQEWGRGPRMWMATAGSSARVCKRAAKNRPGRQMAVGHRSPARPMRVPAAPDEIVRRATAGAGGQPGGWHQARAAPRRHRYGSLSCVFPSCPHECVAATLSWACCCWWCCRW